MNCKRFALASLVGLLTVTGIYSLLPSGLTTTTDILGYPVHSNYNVDRHFNLYYLVGLLLPLLTWAIYNRVWVRQVGVDASAPRPVELADTPSRFSTVWQLLRVVVTGWVLSVASVAWPQVGVRYFALTCLCCTTVYTLAMYLLARGELRKMSFWNGCLTPLTVLCLPALSSITRVSEVGGGVRQFGWFPLWLGIAACVALLAYAVPKMRRTQRIGQVADAEADLVMLIPGSIVVFLLRAVVIGDLGGVDLFHSGETLGSAYLIGRGYFPWRDLIFIHGLLEDPFKSLLGIKLFENTVWGATLGITLLLTPLYWVVFYIFCVGLFAKHRAFVLSVNMLLPFVLPQLFNHAHLRFLLNPLMVLAFFWMVRGKRVVAAVVFSLLALVQVVVTPESIFNLPAFGVTVLIFELCHWSHQRSFSRNLRLTLTVGVCGVVSAMTWFGYLASHGALTGYVEYFASFGTGLRYAGGRPISDSCLGPLIAIWVSIWVLLTKLRSDRRGIDALDWTWMALALLVAMYYQKYLSRSDGVHSVHVFAASYPVFAIIAVKALSCQWVRERWRALNANATPIAARLVLVLVLAVVWPGHIRAMVTALPTHFSATAHPNHKWRMAGYFQLAQDLDLQVTDLNTFFDQYLAPNEKIFDFTNAPALYFFLLERLPATRFFHVSMAMHRGAQKLLTDELTRDRPRFVIYSSRSIFSWDSVPNMVRHYDISRYILQHYRPFVTLNGYVILQRRDLQLPAPEPALFQGELTANGRSLSGLLEECAWGYSPHFGTADPVGYKTARAIAAPFEAVGNLVKIQVPSQALTHSTSLVMHFESLQKDRFTIAASETGLAVPAQRISFRSLTEKTPKATYVIPLSSCGQWLDFLTGQGVMYLAHENAQTIRSIEFRM